MQFEVKDLVVKTDRSEVMVRPQVEFKLASSVALIHIRT